MDIEYDKAFTKHFVDDPLFEDFIQNRRPDATANFTHANLLPSEAEPEPKPPGYLEKLYPSSIANLGKGIGSPGGRGAAGSAGGDSRPSSPDSAGATTDKEAEVKKWSKKNQAPQRSPFRVISLRISPGPEAESQRLRDDVFAKFDSKQLGKLYVDLLDRDNPVRQLFRECQLSSSYLLACVKCDLKSWKYLSLLIIQFAAIGQWNAEDDNPLKKRIDRLFSERAYLFQQGPLTPWTKAVAQVPISIPGWSEVILWLAHYAEIFDHLCYNLENGKKAITRLVHQAESGTRLSKNQMAAAVEVLGEG